jgi:hypothetical protein
VASAAAKAWALLVIKEKVRVIMSVVAGSLAIRFN